MMFCSVSGGKEKCAICGEVLSISQSLESHIINIHASQDDIKTNENIQTEEQTSQIKYIIEEDVNIQVKEEVLDEEDPLSLPG